MNLKGHFSAQMQLKHFNADRKMTKSANTKPTPPFWLNNIEWEWSARALEFKSLFWLQDELPNWLVVICLAMGLLEFLDSKELEG